MMVPVGEVLAFDDEHDTSSFAVSRTSAVNARFDSPIVQYSQHTVLQHFSRLALACSVDAKLMRPSPFALPSALKA